VPASTLLHRNVAAPTDHEGTNETIAESEGRRTGTPSALGQRERPDGSPERVPCAALLVLRVDDATERKDLLTPQVVPGEIGSAHDTARPKRKREG